MSLWDLLDVQTLTFNAPLALRAFPAKIEFETPALFLSFMVLEFSFHGAWPSEIKVVANRAKC